MKIAIKDNRHRVFSQNFMILLLSETTLLSLKLHSENTAKIRHHHCYALAIQLKIKTQ